MFLKPFRPKVKGKHFASAEFRRLPVQRKKPSNYKYLLIISRDCDREIMQLIRVISNPLHPPPSPTHTLMHTCTHTEAYTQK